MNEEQEKRTEAEKLIIFGWIITIIPEMQNWCAGDPAKRAKINKLVDKMHELMAADSRTRKEAGKLDIKMRVVEYDENNYDKVKHEVFITRNLGTLMTDDDGGMYGVEQAQADAAEEVYGDHMLYENFTVEEMEVMLPKSQPNPPQDQPAPSALGDTSNELRQLLIEDYGFNSKDPVFNKMMCDLDTYIFTHIAEAVRRAEIETKGVSLQEQIEQFVQNDMKDPMSVANTATVMLIMILCAHTNATTAKMKVSGLTWHDKPLGDWQVTVKQLKAAGEVQP